MTLLHEMTGAQLAATLRDLPDEPDPFTGWLSQLDEAALFWSCEHPLLHELQLAFSQARLAYQDALRRQHGAGRVRLAWAGVLHAALDLATLLAEEPLSGAHLSVSST